MLTCTVQRITLVRRYVLSLCLNCS
uniref:Uncharacterized protein n=1 Tax=Anguilla anguilla TaxID=7936 RepID=A0A0E9T706_ANGAN